MSDDEELDHETLGKKVAFWFKKNKLQTVLFQIIEELPPEKLNEYREIFSFFDRDGGGSIGAEEFEQVMRTFGWEPTEEELKAWYMIVCHVYMCSFCQDMVSVIDQDGDGDINFNEFVWLMTRWLEHFSRLHLQFI